MSERGGDWAARHAGWERSRLAEARERSPERRNRISTISDVEVRGVYGPWDLEEGETAAKIGLPGEPPFTRGIHPTGYRSRLWTMRMFAGFGSAEDTNARFRQLLDAGQTGLSIAYDMPTLYGYDTDDPEAAGELIVIEVLIRSSGRPSRRTSMSARLLTATPQVPNSPAASGSSVS